MNSIFEVVRWTFKILVWIKTAKDLTALTASLCRIRSFKQLCETFTKET